MSSVFLKSKTKEVNKIGKDTTGHEAVDKHEHLGKDDAQVLIQPFQVACRKFDRSTANRSDRTKLPLTYIGMIARAINSSPENKLVLADIYSHMEHDFSHYLSNRPRWKNTVRHNLSFHKCFVKCGCAVNGARSHYWSIHPDFVEQFNRGNFNKDLDEYNAPSTNPRPWSTTQHLSFLNQNHKQPHISIRTPVFPFETLAQYVPTPLISPPNGNGLIPFLHPHINSWSYMEHFTTPGVTPSSQYLYPQHLVPVSWHEQYLKTPTTKANLSHLTQES